MLEFLNLRPCIYTCLLHLQSIYFILLAAEFHCTSVYLSHQMMNSLKGGITSSDLCRAEIAGYLALSKCSVK